MNRADIGIIGAGIVGCAIARHLAITYQSSGKKATIMVLEKYPTTCMETSRFNSGVNHSGFHQKPGSLKAKLAFRGSQLMNEYVEANLPPDKFLNCGMLIAISKQEILKNLIHDVPSLVRMLTRGTKQGINFKFVGAVKIKDIEPNIEALGGIFIPQVSVIDPVAVTESFQKDAVSQGVQFFFNHSVAKIKIRKEGYIVYTENNEFTFKCLINSAGLYADEMASMADINKYKIYPWRGEYYELVGLPKDYIRTLVYPAISKNSPGKGIHFRPLMNGMVLVGPSAKLVDSKSNYHNDRLEKDIFLGGAQKFFPDIKKENLIPSYAGIRPKLNKHGLEEDFIISLDRNQPPLINLVAIESPGLSSSMAIAEYVRNLLSSAGI